MTSPEAEPPISIEQAKLEEVRKKIGRAAKTLKPVISVGIQNFTDEFGPKSIREQTRVLIEKVSNLNQCSGIEEESQMVEPLQLGLTVGGVMNHRLVGTLDLSADLYYDHLNQYLGVFESMASGLKLPVHEYMAQSGRDMGLYIACSMGRKALTLDGSESLADSKPNQILRDAVGYIVAIVETMATEKIIKESAR